MERKNHNPLGVTDTGVYTWVKTEDGWAIVGLSFENYARICQTPPTILRSISFRDAGSGLGISYPVNILGVYDTRDIRKYLS